MTAAGREALAIDGGRPVRSTFLPYARQQISDADVDAVAAALRSDWLTTGPRVPEFEAGLIRATGARLAALWRPSSSSSAIMASLRMSAAVP